MITEILPVDDFSLELSAKIINQGGVVAFPTETVYGLGANALNNVAVKKIFSIKGRPADNPLIVHVYRDYDISSLVSFIPDYAKKLAQAFVPGPLTMVYKSKSAVCPAVSCGLDTLAVRVPSMTTAQKFLKYVNLPIAAPSANISKHVSPVTAEHVKNDLNGKIPLILDGGQCTGGIESTVLDCTGEIPVILRNGLVTKQMIESIVGECGEAVFKEGEAVRSPGMKYNHYSPNCGTAFFNCDEIEKAKLKFAECKSSGVNAYILCDADTAKYFDTDKILNLGSSEEEIAVNLYLKLREGEKLSQMIIAVAPKKQSGIMAGVMNRLIKACKKL